METSEFIGVLDREGRALAAAAEAAGVDRAVPTCPEWRVRELVEHTGAVHRWARAYVAEGIAERQPLAPAPRLDDPGLLDWFREGHRLLVDTLTTAPPGIACFAFLPAPSPLAFWARRQAHETTVHRYDAESATGAEPAPVATDFAVDGIDELLRGFHARERSRVRTEEPRLLRVRATDADDAVWTVRLSPGPPVTVRADTADADCELAGPASALYLALWNRRPLPEVHGDGTLAALWTERSAI
ncbi:maleylpyruvate isomerase family mycothiol-dependent enzyme [Streptomyces niveiscabiei]|uniref:maleylpyruvate isomerase family mycothiol-dependent enzyme n=1 Tax=Streptomyces niveiscabiei TaxID=164115 RepID=UPI0029AEA67D|nr:maleylpyruvate isomerase family mycothiol-dependent enzyme [Streptomyces niveiscabiei]MDX3384296.1 maleylpyruvate isomerase family mycothiol-dependent enzyme [Streptomyces niveiscabiei]